MVYGFDCVTTRISSLTKYNANVISKFVGNEITRIRKKFGITQKQLAKMLSVSQPRIARMEQQETVTVRTLKRIAEKLGVSLKDIINNG